MTTIPVCQAAADVPLVFACSGAADVGALADGAARALTAGGTARMSCLAGVGGAVATVVDKVRTASHLLAIDGCSGDCAWHTLRRGGFANVDHVRVTDLGFEKGKSPVTAERVAAVVGRCKAALAE